MLNYKKIGKFILNEREKLKITQEELAKKLYVTRQAISKWERGISIPDYSLLESICEIFDVTVNELLAGERKVKNNTEFIDNITIDIIKHNKIMVKKITISSLIIIVTLLILFFTYYFISTYNQFKIYKINGENDNFKILDTLVVFSPNSYYLKLSNIKTNYEIKNITLYYEKDNLKKEIYSSNQKEILLIENAGYNEYFNFKDIKLVMNNLYLKITYYNEEEKIDIIKLKTEKIYTNNKIIFNQEQDIKEKNIENLEINNQKLLKIKEEFTLVNNEYILNIRKNNKTINIVFNENINSFIVYETKDNLIEEYYFFDIFNGENYEYHKILNNEEVTISNYNNKEITCNKGNCDNIENKYNYFKTNYIDKYLK